MKDSGLLMFLLLVIGTAAFGYSTSKGSSSTSSNPGFTWVSNENAVASPLEVRKIKLDEMDPWVSKFESETDEGEINLEDYRPIDPVPSSKASIRHGPVQHATPLMPYIPNPEPSPPPPPPPPPPSQLLKHP